jgi:hypothetical protein
MKLRTGSSGRCDFQLLANIALHNINSKIIMIIIIFSIVAGIIVLLLFVALFMKKGYQTQSEINVNAPLSKVFNYIKHIKNQDNFNKWIMVDPDMKKEFKGNDGTVGFIYAWSGNKEAGEGEQEIKALREDESIEMEIRFIRPFSGVAKAKMTTGPLAGGETKLTWNTASDMKYPLNLMLPMITRMLQKDMAASLITLKNILEK